MENVTLFLKKCHLIILMSITEVNPVKTKVTVVFIHSSHKDFIIKENTIQAGKKLLKLLT